MTKRRQRELILAELERFRGSIVPHRQLLDAMYPRTAPPRTELLVLRVQMRRLRRSLPPGLVIVNVHGLGYRLTTAPTAPTPAPTTP